MSQCNRTNTKEKMAVALGDFLSESPDNLSIDLIEAFGRMVKTNDGILPPRVFFEAVEQSSVAISITDTRADILYTNQAFEKLTGYDPEEIVGKNQSILSYKVTPVEVYEDLWAHLLAQKSWNGVLINRRKDGQRYIADLTVAPVIGTDGQASYYLALHRDVTEVHELEHKVLNQKILIESVVDAAPVVMALMNSDGKIILDNHSYKKLMGDLRGQEPAKLFLEQLGNVFEAENHLPCLQRKGFINQEISIRDVQSVETRWFNCSGVWVNETVITADDYYSDTEQCFLLLVANDITQQKIQQNQIKINAMRALVAEQQLVHGMRETLSGAIFQLQAPLNMATAVLSMLERKHEVSDELCQFQSALTDVITSSKQVLDSLQQALPVEDQEIESLINMNEVIKNVIDLSINRLLEKSIQLDWKPEVSFPAINGRCYALHNLFKQLLDNAVLAIDELGADRREVSIKTKYDDAFVEIAIQDTGAGIPVKKRHLVFEPFYSDWETPARRSGMGLTIAMEIVQQHRGSIEIDSYCSSGCLINVRLPRNISQPMVSGVER